MTLSPFISLIVSRLRFLSSRGHRILVRASDRRRLFSTRARKGYQLAAYHGQSEGMYKRRIVVLTDVASPLGSKQLFTHQRWLPARLRTTPSSRCRHLWTIWWRTSISFPVSPKTRRKRWWTSLLVVFRMERIIRIRHNRLDAANAAREAAAERKGASQSSPDTLLSKCLSICKRCLGWNLRRFLYGCTLILPYKAFLLESQIMKRSYYVKIIFIVFGIWNESYNEKNAWMGRLRECMKLFSKYSEFEMRDN